MILVYGGRPARRAEALAKVGRLRKLACADAVAWQPPPVIKKKA